MTSLVATGILGCLALLVLLLLSVPVGFALMLVGSIGFAIVMGSPIQIYNILVSTTFDNFSNYGLSVIPLFIFMGQIAFHAGISRRLFDATFDWFGHLPGGLGLATTGACAGFGAVCGSGPASAATMAAVALPEMKRHGYDTSFAAGMVAAGSSLGILIPPSVVAIVYAVMTESSPAKVFAASVVPGILITLLFCIYITITSLRHPELCPHANPVPWKQRWKSLLGVLETVLLFLLVMGGMLFFGWFTPTEGAAVGAGGALLIALFRRSLTPRTFMLAVSETIRTSCMVLVIVTGALVFGRFLAVTGLPTALAEVLAGLPVSRYVTMSIILVFYMIAGCFVDALALVMLTVPIFLPVVSKLGFDLTWFGLMIVMVVELGVITPPVGVNVYVVSGIERSVPLVAIFRRAFPFALLITFAVILLMIFPQIGLWLPHALHF
ncbi:MAG: TRAP transporter large permease [Victivallales bacterium]|nr:TRAP transporter large permease [Victivallales bacterium]